MRKLGITIVETTGCTADYFAVDGIEIKHMTEAQISEVRISLLGIIANDKNIRIDDLLTLIEHDTFEMDEEPCGQCGDYMQTTRWEI